MSIEDVEVQYAPMTDDSRRTRRLLFGVLLLAMALQIWLFWPIVANYVPTNDEIALVAGSTDIGGVVSPSVWFTQGFDDFFHSYPEWHWDVAVFARPATNALYWLNQSLFGGQWAAQLWLGYAAHALVIALVGHLALTVLRLRLLTSSAVMLIAALNPAFWSRYNNPYSIPLAIQFPVYQTEIFVALLGIFGLFAFLRRRFVRFGLLMTLAVLFKDTALTTPVAALALYGSWRETRPAGTLRNGLWLALPLLVYGAIKCLLLKAHSQLFVFETAGPGGWLIQTLRNLLFWPSSLFDAGLGAVPQAFRAGHWLEGVALLGSFAINLVWLGLLVWALWQLLQAGRRGVLFRPATAAEAILMLAVANLALSVLLPRQDLRYGYLWFALGPMGLFALLETRLPRRVHGWADWIVPVLAGALILVEIPKIQRSLSTDSFAAYRLQKQAAGNLTRRLAQLPRTVRVAYVVDEMVNKGTSEEYLAKFTGFKGKIVFIDSLLPIVGCTDVIDDADRYRLHREGQVSTLEYRRPSCFEIVKFMPIDRIADDNSLPRGPNMQYRFPDLRRILSKTLTASRPEVDLGDRAEVRVDDPRCAEPDACVWLGYNVATREYQPVSLVVSAIVYPDNIPKP